MELRRQWLLGEAPIPQLTELLIHAEAEQIISYSKGAELLGLSLTEFDQEVHIVS